MGRGGSGPGWSFLTVQTGWGFAPHKNKIILMVDTVLGSLSCLSSGLAVMQSWGCVEAGVGCEAGLCVFPLLWDSALAAITSASLQKWLWGHRARDRIFRKSNLSLASISLSRRSSLL